MGEVIRAKDRIIVINGGEFLHNADIPSTWNEAWKVVDEWNILLGFDELNPTDPKMSPVVGWGWDCGYKLDFDVECLSCRFYPPTKFYGHGWDGYMMYQPLKNPSKENPIEIRIRENTLNELRNKVESIYLMCFMEQSHVRECSREQN